VGDASRSFTIDKPVTKTPESSNFFFALDELFGLELVNDERVGAQRSSLAWNRLLRNPFFRCKKHSKGGADS